MRRFPLAPLLVGALGLLAAGGAILGALQAPTGSNLAVHNGAQETLLASRVVGNYRSSQYAGVVISFDFRSPDHVSEVERGSSGQVQGKRNLTGSQASSVLGPVRQLLSLNHFTAHGSYYEETQPASVLVTPALRSKVTGTYRTEVQLDAGYVVAILLRVDAHEGSRPIAERIDYRLSRVGAWTRSS